MEIKALGNHVVISVEAKSAGTEIIKNGIYVGVREQGELPQYGKIISIGDTVPEGMFEIGDIVPLPNGNMRNVPHPRVALEGIKPKEEDEKFVTAHYSAIAAVYK
ncbi:head assembly chaperone protein [Providencia phage PSTCR6]|nr:head assembly chaperone protein [Providencia phage PSTCR6]